MSRRLPASRFACAFAVLSACAALSGCALSPAPPSLAPDAAMMQDVSQRPGQVNPADFARLINDYRAQNGLGPVQLDPALAGQAQVYANALAQAGVMTHYLEPYGGIGRRLGAAGYGFSVAAENLGMGQRSLSGIFEAWRKSPDHDANMRDRDVTRFGIAYAINPSARFRTFWVLELAKPRAFLSGPFAGPGLNAPAVGIGIPGTGIRF